MIYKLRKFSKGKVLRVFIFLLTLCFTFILRAHNYDKEPLFGHLEEHLYAWSGLSLIETGSPVSWSNLDYPKRAEVFRGKIDYYGRPPDAYVNLYKPWLDEPPLFSLLVGVFAHSYHADRHFIIPSSYIRLPIIFISTATSILIFLIARLTSRYWLGILSMLLYGTVPIFLISSRMAVPENLIALFFSVIIYMLLRFEIKPSFKWLLPIPLIAGIAGLSKPTGYLLIPLSVYFALTKKFYKTSIFLILATIPFFLIFIWYGTNLDAQIFWHIFSIQGQRPVGFSGLAWLFTSPGYDIDIFLDSWYVFALLSGFFFLMAPKQGLKRYISLAFIYWIIIVLLTGGEGDMLPWYRIPAYPMMAILAGWGLEYIYKNINFFTMSIGAGLLLGSRRLLVNAFRPNISPLGFRVIFSSITLPSLIHTLYPKKFLTKVSRILLVAIVIVGIYYNVVYIYNQFELTCESKSCPIGPSTFLSTLYFPIIWKWFSLGPSELH